ncbi:hypothetical protein NMY22_g11919 [Coprinellus aureogranulatus]|nr:hypothetical protein NMY22_g11919 [Coprinellus aureogranulatus]
MLTRLNVEYQASRLSRDAPRRVCDHAAAAVAVAMSSKSDPLSDPGDRVKASLSWQPLLPCTVITICMLSVLNVELKTAQTSGRVTTHLGTALATAVEPSRIHPVLANLSGCIGSLSSSPGAAPRLSYHIFVESYSCCASEFKATTLPPFALILRYEAISPGQRRCIYSPDGTYNTSLATELTNRNIFNSQ